MDRARHRLYFVLSGIVAIAISIPGISVAQEHGEEYRSTAEVTPILRDTLFAIEGKEAQVMRVVFPAGWVGERHYHTGDVFVYVLKGQFVVDVEGEERKTFGPGQVYHEALETVMQARNLSTTEPTEVVLFQVGEPGEPLMIRAGPR